MALRADWETISWTAEVTEDSVGRMWTLDAGARFRRGSFEVMVGVKKASETVRERRRRSLVIDGILVVSNDGVGVLLGTMVSNKNRIFKRSVRVPAIF
jgi:hypothetical protein